MYLLALFVLFVTNLACVDDIVNQGTCDWICTANTDIDEEELKRNLLANGSLAKFRVLYEEQVHGECANQTNAKNSRDAASLWLKMADGGKPGKKHQGLSQLVTETVSHGIFRGQFAFGAYKEVNVSCIFKLTSIGKSSSNYSSRRLTFRTMESVLYYVEQVASYSLKPNATFLTLLRTEKNTRLSVGVTDTSGRLSSAKFANENELIVTDGWFAVAIIIWIVVLLYFPAIFIFFRPSEIKMKVPRRTQEEQEDKGTTDKAAERERRRLHIPAKPVQSTEQDFYIVVGNIREGHASPTEHDAMFPFQSNSSSAGSHEVSEIAEGTYGSSLLSKIQHGGGAIPGYSGSAETERPSDQDSKITLRPRRFPRPETMGHNGGRFEPKHVNEKNPTKLVSLPEDLNATDDSDTKNGCRFSDVRTSTVPLRSETPPTVLNESSTTNDQLFSSDNQDIKEPISTRNSSDLNTSQNRKNDSEQASTSQSDRIFEEPSDANISNVTRIVMDQSNEEEEVLAIIVGETYPVGFESCIGNKLFSTTHKRNITWNILKLTSMFSALPLLFFLILGDLFLVLLPKLNSRLSDHFPSPFLTRSLGYGFLTSHPILLVPIVFSALAYLIRLFSVCFLSSSTIETKWQSCCVHRMHLKCFSRKLFQYFISEFSPSLHVKPCENCCNSAPSECLKYLDVPQNILHNLKKQPDIFIQCWECCSDFWNAVQTSRKSICSRKVGLFLLAFLALVIIIIIFFIIGIFCTSPLVCLCHGRLRLFGSRVIESVVMIFSMVWVTILTLLYAIPLGVVTTGLIKVLGSHTIQVLPQVSILVLVLHYVSSCYKSFRKPYRYVAKFLASPYQKRFDQHEQNSGVNALICYRQGDFKIIPKELFDDGCKDFGLSIKNDVMLLFVKLLFTLLVFSFVYPILGSNRVLDPATTSAIITFLAVAYLPINNAINGGEVHIFEAEADKVVNDYIARKQQEKKKRK